MYASKSVNGSRDEVLAKRSVLEFRVFRRVRYVLRPRRSI